MISEYDRKYTKLELEKLNEFKDLCEISSLGPIKTILDKNFFKECEKDIHDRQDDSFREYNPSFATYCFLYADKEFYEPHDGMSFKDINRYLNEIYEQTHKKNVFRGKIQRLLVEHFRQRFELQAIIFLYINGILSDIDSKICYRTNRNADCKVKIEEQEIFIEVSDFDEVQSEKIVHSHYSRESKYVRTSVGTFTLDRIEQIVGTKILGQDGKADQLSGSVHPTILLLGLPSGFHFSPVYTKVNFQEFIVKSVFADAKASCVSAIALATTHPFNIFYFMENENAGLKLSDKARDFFFGFHRG